MMQVICAHIGMKYIDGQENAKITQSHHAYGSGGVRGQLMKGDGLSIKKEPVFSPEFEGLIPQMESHIKYDNELQQILHELGKRDIRNGMTQHKNEKFTRIKPTWYYFDKMKAITRRWRPVSSDYAE